ncbi:MAG: acyltransferase family protein, partial [Thermodesulfovibrionales bacterium]
VKPYIKRIVLIYAIWSLIYLPLRIITWVEAGSSMGNILKSYIKDILINGTYSHLWFFPSLIIGIVFVGTLLRFMKIKSVVIISLVMFCIGIMSSIYLPIVKNTIGGASVIEPVLKVIGTRNGLFYGFLYVALGTFLASRRDALKRTGIKKWIFS